MFIFGIEVKSLHDLVNDFDCRERVGPCSHGFLSVFPKRKAPFTKWVASPTEVQVYAFDAGEGHDRTTCIMTRPQTLPASSTRTAAEVSA